MVRKKKRGRPLIGALGVRKILQVSVSEETAKWAEAGAAATHVSVSAFCRQILEAARSSSPSSSPAQGV